MFTNTMFCGHESGGLRRIIREVRGNGARRLNIENVSTHKKDLLRRMVKKVLIHDKRTIEIWYALPNPASVRAPEYLAPRGERCSNC